MTSTAKTPEEYLDSLPDDRKQAMSELRKQILENLPEGFAEGMTYGMIGYFVPHSLYPAGYFCNPKMPMPYINIASQKNYVAIYHMGIYGDKNLFDYFVNEYAKFSNAKLDMGKGCIRFKKMDQIPHKLIGEIVSKITVQQWIEVFESRHKK